MINPIFFTETFTCVLPYNNNLINPKIESLALNKGLVIKDNLHITIIGSDTGEEILNTITQKNLKRSEEIIFIESIIKQIDWKIKLFDEYYYIEKTYPEYIDKKGKPEFRKSIIQLVNIDNLSDLYSKINNRYSLNLQIPFGHITIYSYSSIPEKINRGIGLYSEEQFFSLNPNKIN